VDSALGVDIDHRVGWSLSQGVELAPTIEALCSSHG
jgi:hypothetical protein